MKKVLALVLMVFSTQGLISQQQPTQYKYLNRLSEDSQIRKKCESVQRAWFVKGPVENRCDSLDGSYDLYRRIICGEDVKEPIYSGFSPWFKHSLPEPKIVASIDMGAECISQISNIFPEIRMKDREKEHNILMSLAYKIRAEETEPSELKRLLQEEVKYRNCNR